MWGGGGGGGGVVYTQPHPPPHTHTHAQTTLSAPIHTHATTLSAPIHTRNTITVGVYLFLLMQTVVPAAWLGSGGNQDALENASGDKSERIDAAVESSGPRNTEEGLLTIVNACKNGGKNDHAKQTQSTIVCH